VYAPAPGDPQQRNQPNWERLVARSRLPINPRSPSIMGRGPRSVDVASAWRSGVGRQDPAPDSGRVWAHHRPGPISTGQHPPPAANTVRAAQDTASSRRVHGEFRLDLASRTPGAIHYVSRDITYHHQNFLQDLIAEFLDREHEIRSEACFGTRDAQEGEGMLHDGKRLRAQSCCLEVPEGERPRPTNSFGMTSYEVYDYDTYDDKAVLRNMLEFIRVHDTASLLRVFGIEESAAAHCRFDHGAVLVFPSSLDALRADLAAEDVVAGEVVPSVVVRERLKRRYGHPHLDVRILRAPVGDAMIELFVLFDGPVDVVAAERAQQNETHLALQVVAPDQILLSGLTAALTRAGLVPDGGGYNSYVDSTVLYFRGARQRLELICQGHHAAVLTAHLRQQPEYRLLNLMTGAWQTQALAVAAELRLSDLLRKGMSPKDIAEKTGANYDSLLRLLRYLASLGVLHGRDFQPTEMGELLCMDSQYSLRQLALLYGGAFYQSFGALGRAVHTGCESFEHVFGEHHFDYFANHPELGFNQAMASSASIFGQIDTVYDFSTKRVVVDIGGGNGELLNHVLDAGPHLEGILFERPDVIASLQTRERCTYIAGDFTTGIPDSGDIYLLSRVLHDWDDQQCRNILKRCAESMRADADLLIVERLLPEDASPSLAFPWDIHMLCNVGGRERTRTQYRQLLANTGFTLTATTELPLDFALLQAHPDRCSA
jgi:hypothetical protein